MESIIPRVVGALILSAIILNTIFLIVIFYTRRKVAQAESWSSTVGTVTLSTIDLRKSGNRISTQYPFVRYSYQVMGREYEANKIMPGAEFGGSSAQKVIDRYPVGTRVTVFYNPHNPYEAVLEKKAPAQWVMWLVLIIINGMLFGMATLFASKM